jgi:hypothetical protein
MSDSADDLDLGQTVRGFAVGQKLFGRYTLKAVLGRGGMGIVWRAFDEELERDVALKFLPEVVARDKSLLRDLKRETLRSLELTHPHIVRINDFIPDDHSPCISMEYVNGDTLSNLRAEKRANVFEVAELADYVRQLCEALEYAHTRAQIVHRDLKPANLMVNSRGDLKVTDFGISRSLTDSVSMISMRTSGTLVYMSPQQLDGERSSPADDIYSLGATLYELLTGKPPFYSGNIDRQIHEKMPVSMAARRAELDVQSAEAIPTAWEETIAACLAKAPARRPATAAEVAQRLAAGGKSVQTASIDPASAPPSGLPWKPKRAAAAAAVLLLLTCGATAGWWFAVEKPRRHAEAQGVAEGELKAETDRNAEEKRKEEATRAAAAKTAEEKRQADERVTAAAATRLAEEKRLAEQNRRAQEEAAATKAAEEKGDLEKRLAAAAAAKLVEENQQTEQSRRIEEEAAQRAAAEEAKKKAEEAGRMITKGARNSLGKTASE